MNTFLLWIRSNNKYFTMPNIDYMDCEVWPGVRSLYCLAKLAEKQVMNVVIPPTVLLGFNHDNMFIYTKPSTK